MILVFLLQVSFPDWLAYLYHSWWKAAVLGIITVTSLVCLSEKQKAPENRCGYSQLIMIEWSMYCMLVSWDGLLKCFDTLYAERKWWDILQSNGVAILIKQCVYLLTPKDAKELHFNNEFLRGDTVFTRSYIDSLHNRAVIMEEVVNRSLTPLSSESNY